MVYLFIYGDKEGYRIQIQHNSKLYKGFSSRGIHQIQTWWARSEQQHLLYGTVMAGTVDKEPREHWIGRRDHGKGLIYYSSKTAAVLSVNNSRGLEGRILLEQSINYPLG